MSEAFLNSPTLNSLLEIKKTNISVKYAVIFIIAINLNNFSDSALASVLLFVSPETNL